MRASQDLERLGEVRVAGNRPMVVAIRAHEIGEHFGVAGVGLGPRSHMPFAIPAGCQRIDRIDQIATRAQGAHQQPAIGLDAHDHLARLGRMFEDQSTELTNAGDALGDPLLGQNPSALIHQTDVVMGFSRSRCPRRSRHHLRSKIRRARGDLRRTNGKISSPADGGTLWA